MQQSFHPPTRLLLVFFFFFLVLVFFQCSAAATAAHNFTPQPEPNVAASCCSGERAVAAVGSHGSSSSCSCGSESPSGCSASKSARAGKAKFLGCRQTISIEQENQFHICRGSSKPGRAATEAMQPGERERGREEAEKRSSSETGEGLGEWGRETGGSTRLRHDTNDNESGGAAVTRQLRLRLRRTRQADGWSPGASDSQAFWERRLRPERQWEAGGRRGEASRFVERVQSKVASQANQSDILLP